MLLRWRCLQRLNRCVHVKPLKSGDKFSEIQGPEAAALPGLLRFVALPSTGPFWGEMRCDVYESWSLRWFSRHRR